MNKIFTVLLLLSAPSLVFSQTKKAKPKTAAKVELPTSVTICEGDAFPDGYTIGEQKIVFECYKKNQTGKAFVLNRNGSSSASESESASTESVTSQYDKFEDKTAIFSPKIITAIHLDQVSQNILIQIRMEFKGEGVSSAPQNIRLMIVSTSYSSRFQSNNSDLDFIADKTRLHFGQPLAKSTALGDGVIDVLEYSVTRADLQTIANSKIVNFRLGLYEGVLTATQRQSIINLLKFAK